MRDLHPFYKGGAASFPPAEQRRLFFFVWSIHCQQQLVCSFRSWKARQKPLWRAKTSRPRQATARFRRQT